MAISIVVPIVANWLRAYMIVMIGHLSDRHRHFGWAAARADDLANLPASRPEATAAASARP